MTEFEHIAASHHDCFFCARLMASPFPTEIKPHRTTGNPYAHSYYACIGCDVWLEQKIPVKLVTGDDVDVIETIRVEKTVPYPQAPLLHCAFCKRHMYMTQVRTTQNERTDHTYYEAIFGCPRCQHIAVATIPEKLAREQWGVEEMPPKEGYFLTSENVERSLIV